jgi:hypothetical protein
VGVRFLILFSLRSEEVFYSLAAVVKRLQNSFDKVWIGALIQNDLRWIIQDNNSFDELISFNRTPGENKQEIKDLHADYLLDLSGEPRFWLFRSRLRVLDFKFSAGQIKSYRNSSAYPAGFREFNRKTIELLSVFDLQDDPGKISWSNPKFDDIRQQILPENFLKAYFLIDLENLDVWLESHLNKMKEWLGILEYPTVLIGNSDQKAIGNEISQTVGCSVFNTCGDLSEQESRIVRSAAKGFWGSGHNLKLWTFITGTTGTDLLSLSEEQLNSNYWVVNLRKMLKEE